MPRFPELPDDEYANVYLEDTDRELPEKINQSTRYAYYKTIAKGGKSIIQSCKDLHLARVICHKQLRPEFENDSTEQQRFLREARVTAALQHPSIIPTYEVGRTSKGHYFFTMKLVHGLTMRELFDEEYRDNYDMVQLVDVLIHVAQALRYAHSHRVIHRDIKPDNILIGPFDEVLLMDWGLAKVWRKDGSEDEPANGKETDGGAEVTSLTGSGNLEGTIAYMSPEQLRKDPAIDYRTDIYSMGVVLYEMLARRTPFVGETISEMTTQIFEVEPPRPSTLTPIRVPSWLEDIALQCMAKLPDDRIQGCRELIRRLQEGWDH
jgi:serine/threonine protein kinase